MSAGDLMVNRVTSYTLFVACILTFCATNSKVALSSRAQHGP